MKHRPAHHVDSYYAATLNDHTRYPLLQGDIDVDVCIVGGGYTGLTTALELQERGFRTAVLEAYRVGWGASGRNGGQICTGFAPGMAKISKWVGLADAQKMWDMVEEGKDIIRTRVNRHNIQCDLKWGYIFAAVKERQMEDLIAEQAVLKIFHHYNRTRLLDRDAIGNIIESDAYVGGMFDGGGGHFHPLNYAVGLARAAAEEGVALYEESPVIDLSFGAQPVVRTPQGRVKARFVVFAGNAYLGKLVPALRSKIMPVGTYVAATQPLGEERAHRLIRNDAAVADCNFVLNYFRLSADHRLLFGGRVSYTTWAPPNLPKAMRQSMLKVYPQLEDVKFDYVWGGNVAITVERTPHIGRVYDNVYFAQGFSGMGVVLTGVAGRILAEAIAGQAERFDLFAKLPHTSFVGGRAFRMPMLATAMMWYRLRDLL